MRSAFASRLLVFGFSPTNSTLSVELAAMRPEATGVQVTLLVRRCAPWGTPGTGKTGRTGKTQGVVVCPESSHNLFGALVESRKLRPDPRHPKVGESGESGRL